MPVLAVLAVVPVVAIGVIGLVPAARRRESRPGPVAEFVRRMQGAFGHAGGFALTVAAGAAGTLAICWPLGVLARHIDPADHRAFAWVARRAEVGWLTPAMKLLTQMGNNRETQILTVVAAAGVGAVWWVRRSPALAAIPPVVLLGAYELEHQLQVALIHLAHRGHPPTTLGTFPSGGCARLVLTWGLIAFLLLVPWQRTRTWHAYAAGTFVACAAYVEGFSRVYLSKHWVSDVVAGWIFGLILLAVMIAATRVLDQQMPRSGGSHRAGREVESRVPDSVRG